MKAPENLRDTDKTTLSWEQLRAALSRLSLKERLILELDMTNALRPEELFGLRWRCFNYSEKGSNLELRERVYRGEIRPWGKTKCSLRTIPIPRKLADDLWLWKQECPNSSPEAFIFAKNKKGEFMDSGNFRNRVLHRLAEEARRRIEATQADLPSDPANDRDAGTEEGRRERMSRECCGTAARRPPRMFTCKRFRRASRR